MPSVARFNTPYTAYKTVSNILIHVVNEPPLYVKYGLFIVIAMVVACAVGGVVYYLKFRGR